MSIFKLVSAVFQKKHPEQKVFEEKPHLQERLQGSIANVCINIIQLPQNFELFLRGGIIPSRIKKKRAFSS